MEPDDLLEHAIAAYGSAPGEDLRTRFLTEAARHPETLRATVNRIADKHAAGAIASPWGVIRAEIDKLANVQPLVKRSNDRERALQRAEQWMRAAGAHFDRYDEIHDELFGERGQLRAWPELEPRIRKLYDTVRPSLEEAAA